MHNKYILYIIGANLFWGCIPVVVSGLFNEISIFMIILLRFLISGLFLFFVAFLLIQYNNHFTENQKISFKTLLHFIGKKNEEFYGLKNIYYHIFLGFFGVVLQIIGYFFALKTTSIALTMIGFPISIILIAFYEHGVKAEKINFFKVLYLLILIFSIGIIITVKLGQTAELVDSPFLGMVYILLFTACITFLNIAINKDKYTDLELKFINQNKIYKLARLMVKISSLFITGIIFMVPFMVIFFYIEIDPVMAAEIAFFLKQFPLIASFLLRWEILFLIVFSTIIPFLFVFFASVNWSPYNLTYNQWNSIMTILEPIGGILFGVLLIRETFPLIFLITVLFLLTMSILLRYSYEAKNIINAYVLIQHRGGLTKNLPFKLLQINGVCCVDSLAGEYDLNLKVKTSSIKDFYDLIENKLQKFENITNIEILFLSEINKLIV
ncbi:MAG: Lrp/AsnC ligand binding domain-containing protein [Promethearchaeia archaeon]